MAPKAGARSIGPARPQQAQGAFRNAINEITSPENRTVVTALTFFAVGVAFLHSSWSEILMPPL